MGEYRSAVMDVLDYNTLCNLVSEGKSDTEIGEMYFVSKDVIFRTRQAWGILKPKNPEKYDWGMIQRMMEQRLSYDDIAYIYQVNRENIRNYVYRKRKEERERA